VEVDHPLAWSAEFVSRWTWPGARFLTRFLSIASKQLGRDYLSVGRVQSPTLALVVDREREIEDFVPQDYGPSRTVPQGFQWRHGGVRKRPRARPYWAHPEAEAALEMATWRRKDSSASTFKTSARASASPVQHNHVRRRSEPPRVRRRSGDENCGGPVPVGYISYPRTDNTVYPSTINLRPSSKNSKTRLSRQRRGPSRARADRGESRSYPGDGPPPIYPVQGVTRRR